jgi:hypothetical protein
MANTDRAQDLLAQGFRYLEHTRGRAKIDEQAIAKARELFKAALDELRSTPRESGELPIGCVEGRANLRRGDWSR